MNCHCVWNQERRPAARQSSPTQEEMTARISQLKIPSSVEQAAEVVKQMQASHPGPIDDIVAAISTVGGNRGGQP